MRTMCVIVVAVDAPLERACSLARALFDSLEACVYSRSEKLGSLRGLVAAKPCRIVIAVSDARLYDKLASLVFDGVEFMLVR